jgi:uncharacterized protein
MKQILLFVGILLIAGACATKKINFDQLQERNGLLFMVNDDEPFTGEIQSYSNGKVVLEGNVKNGLKEGLWISYYPNGQKKTEGLYKDGLKEGTWTYWSENGVQENLEMYKVGTKLGGDAEGKTDEGISGDIQTTTPPEGVSGTVGTTPVVVEKEVEKPKPINYNQLVRAPNHVMFYQGKPYTGSFIKYYREGSKGKAIFGYFTNGQPSGKWTYYHRDGKIKEYKYH